MEDALISPEGFMILSGAGLIDASAEKPIYQHATETVDADLIVPAEGSTTIYMSNKPYIPGTFDESGVLTLDKSRQANYIYVMFMKNGEIISEPYIPKYTKLVEGEAGTKYEHKWGLQLIAPHDIYDTIEDDPADKQYKFQNAVGEAVLPAEGTYDSVLIDYYIERVSDAQQIEITADKFGGNYYLEASTLFRDTNGVDMPAEFIIPNCKIQSNFTFTMASSGDPSTFTFTMDAFPDQVYGLAS